jgi:hypothetical protein
VTTLTPIRCPNCDKKLGEGLDGTYWGKCRGCGHLVRIVQRVDWCQLDLSPGLMVYST